MPEPGWYPDQGDGRLVRWWDGQAWTSHTQPRTAPPAQAPQVPGVSATVGKDQVHADAEVISYAGKTLRLAEVDWVCYFAKRPQMKHGFFGKKSGLGTYFYFQIGHHPYFQGEFIEVHIPKWRDRESDPTFDALVAHVRRYVEPRLVSEITAQVTAGRAVRVGALTLDPAGVRTSRGTFAWRDLTGAAYDGDEIRLYQGAEPVLRVPQANWNVSLLPALVPAVKAATGH